MPSEPSRPILLLDERRVRRNIERMAARAKAAGVRFRPHMKTHGSPAVGGWLRDAGVRAITVSSLAMAKAFAREGWTDVTVAFPLNPREVDEVEALAAEVELGVLVDAEAPVRALAGRRTAPVRVWVKVDTGYGRAGVDWRRPERAAAVARAIVQARSLNFAGLLTHAGHAYRERGAKGVRRVHTEAKARMLAVKSALEAEGFANFEISVGDTPTCSLADDFAGVDEIRPGNFVFFDLMQLAIGSCAPTDLALAVSCPVAGVYPDRGEIVVRGGAVHLSKEGLAGTDGRAVFGALARPDADSLGTPDLRSPATSLNQEHGVIEVDPVRLPGISIGDAIAVFPVHACLAADLHDGYRTLEGRFLPRIGK